MDLEDEEARISKKGRKEIARDFSFISNSKFED